MYPADTIKKIHRELSTLFASHKVLLGGSYLYGHATDQSDLDFYIITTFPWSIFWHHQHYATLVNNLKTELNTPNLKILIVPKLFFRLGWYYIYGQDIDGKIYCSKVNKKIIFRTTIKLAYFHYLGFLVKTNKAERWCALRKTAQQLAAAIVIYSDAPLVQPIFSTTNLIKQLTALGNKEYLVLIKILSTSDQTPTELEQNEWSRGVRTLLNQVFEQGKTWLSFYFPNYLIYNLRFIPKGNFQFLFTNPDRRIITELSSGVKSNENRAEQYEIIKQKVLSVLIF